MLLNKPLKDKLFLFLHDLRFYIPEHQRDIAKVIINKTYGSNKKEENITVRDFRFALEGKSKNFVTDNIRRCLDFGYIERKRNNIGGFTYKISDSLSSMVSKTPFLADALIKEKVSTKDFRKSWRLENLIELSNKKIKPKLADPSKRKLRKDGIEAKNTHKKPCRKSLTSRPILISRSLHSNNIYKTKLYKDAKHNTRATLPRKQFVKGEKIMRASSIEETRKVHWNLGEKDKLKEKYTDRIIEAVEKKITRFQIRVSEQRGYPIICHTPLKIAEEFILKDKLESTTWTFLSPKGKENKLHTEQRFSLLCSRDPANHWWRILPDKLVFKDNKTNETKLFYFDDANYINNLTQKYNELYARGENNGNKTNSIQETKLFAQGRTQEIAGMGTNRDQRQAESLADRVYDRKRSAVYEVAVDQDGGRVGVCNGVGQPASDEFDRKGDYATNTRGALEGIMSKINFNGSNKV
jgi:hypothetical protein